MLVLLPEPHPACSITVPRAAAKNIPSKTRCLREMPGPISASPDTGSQNAYKGPPVRNKLAGVVTRAVVEISRVRLCGPLFKFGMGLLVPNEHMAPDGSPDPQLSETDSGMGPVGVTVTK
jgi:hypothetical protein